MAFEWYSIPSFGGGLRFSDHPAAIEDHEWSWSDGWLAFDGYAEVLWKYLTPTLSGAGWPPASYSGIGLVQNIWEADKTALYGTVRAPGGFTDRLWKVNVFTGAITEITWDAVGVAPTGETIECTMHSAFLNGFQCLNFDGRKTGAGNRGIATYGGGATFSMVSQQADFLVSFAAHIIGGGIGSTTPGGQRTLAWSASNDQTVWAPAASNDADFVLLDDVESGVLGIGRGADNIALVLTRTGIYGLAPTGGIPSFTRQRLAMRGVRESSPGRTLPDRTCYFAETPYGLLYAGGDAFYLAGGQALGQKIFRYYDQAAPTEEASIHQFHWHPTRGVVMIPVARFGGGGSREMLMVDPTGDIWSRQTVALSTTVSTRHAVIHATASSGIVYDVHCMLNNPVGTTSLQVEDVVNLAPVIGAFVDTKDFGGADGPRYIDEIKVDWEPLTNATTDAIEVLAYARNDLSPGILGTDGGQQDFTTQFVSQGVLTGGASELKLRSKGKFTRFRFKQSSGRVRIRGFHLRRQTGGDR